MTTLKTPSYFWRSVFAVLIVCGSAGRAADLSGTISATTAINANSRLVGDVTCTVTGAACLSFGDNFLTLDLNGFTITGQADQQSGCDGASAATTSEVGILISGKMGDTVRGPGIVQRFHSHGVLLLQATTATVTGLTTATNCGSGILIGGGSLNEIRGNVSIRNGSPAAACGGICLAGSSHNHLSENKLAGNGFGDQGFNFGIGLPSPIDTDNTIENNELFGNTNGIFVNAGVQGNTIRGNVALGNPPVQVGLDHQKNNADILNLATAGANLFDENVCLTGVNAPCPTVNPDALSQLTGQLQSLGCGTFPPQTSCQLSVNQWNWYMLNKINVNAQALYSGDGSQQMTAPLYVQARTAAGL
jgi:parallel beta-helix repeat protein